MTENWTIEYEQEKADYEDSAEFGGYIPADGEVIECENCGHFVIDGTICENCGVPTESWLIANPDDEEWGIDESMDGDHESALASVGWGMDEDYRLDEPYEEW